MNKLFDSISKPQLIQEFNNVLADAEALLKATSDQTGDKVAEVRTKVIESIRAVKSSLEDAEIAIVHQSKVAAKATDAYVHENPWQTVGAAAAIGFIIGWLAKRH